MDATTGERVLESIVQRGDLSGLTPPERARFYVQMCEGLGLNPHAQPFAFLRLNGKEVLYATRGATDQLAAIHKLTREIIDGPKVIDLAGTKLVYAVCRVTHPNGRFETATATVPLVDPVNVLMKAETKAKRRATLSILGLGMLDELEIETVPTGEGMRPPSATEIEAARAGLTPEPPPPAPAVAVAPEPPAAPAIERDPEPEPPEPAPAVVAYYECVSTIELPGEAVSVWLKHRGALAELDGAAREAAWVALCTKTEAVGKMRNAKVWLKKAIAEEDARRKKRVNGHAHTARAAAGVA